jgi:hypothetical protein
MGPQSRTPRISNDEKNLISEQPGRFVLFSGVLLAVTLGLILRGLTAPNKVKAMIESAASRIHKDVQVEFEGAHISLARGLLPRFAVVITKVKMESSNECWMQPQLIANEIRLPLSIWAIVQGENPITQVQGDQVEINLRSQYKNCEERPAELKIETPKIKQFVTLKKSTVSTTSAQSSPQVNAILIDQLKILAPSMVEPLELNSFAIRLKSNSPRVVEMTAKTHLMKDEQVGDYLSHATVWGEYSEFPRNTLQTRISGNWREGSYNLNANYSMKEEELTTEMDLKHIPLSQVFQIHKKCQWLTEDLNGRQVWVSLNAQGSIAKSNFKAAQMQLKDLRLEGDLGDLNIESAHVVSMAPVTYMPFTVDIRKVNIEKLFSLLNKSHPSPVLGQLGTFTGKAEVKDENHIEITGVQKGLEFIFANKGQREIQTLNEIATHLKLDNNRWQMQLANTGTKPGVFNGQMQLSADRDLKTLELKAKAQEIRLSPSVVRLMTAGGQVGPLSGDFALKFNNGQMNFVKGTLNSEYVNVEGVEWSKAKFNFDNAGEEVRTQTQIQKMSITVGSPAFQIMKELIEPEWMNENRLQMKNLSAQFNAKSFKTVHWRSFVAQLEKGGRMTSDGEWNEAGILTGQVQTQAGKGNRKWSISGQRDEPVLTALDAAKKKSP